MSVAVGQENYCELKIDHTSNQLISLTLKALSFDLGNHICFELTDTLN
jgi:hypothetical protein